MQRNIKTKQEVKDIVEEEYYSFIRVANALKEAKVDTLTIETPLGDFHYRNINTKIEKNDNDSDNNSN